MLSLLLKNNFKPITYPVIKTGLIGLTKYLATYWIDKGIRCNAFSPVGVKENQNKEFLTKVKKLIPMKRMANKNEYHQIAKSLVEKFQKNFDQYHLGDPQIRQAGPQID